MKLAQKKLNELDRSRITKLEKLIDMVTAFTLHEKQNVIENILAGKKVSTFKLFIEYKEMMTDLSKVVKLTQQFEQELREDASFAEICVICQYPFEVGNQIVKTVCGHQFHTSCLDLHKITSENCPTCRTLMRDD